MTDKQIIIDDVNVSECDFIDTDCGWCGFWEENCATSPNCNYKQLKRLEDHHHELEINAFENLKKLVALEKECEELKAELNKKYIREGIKTYCPFFFRDTATCLGRDLNEIGQLKFCNKYPNCWIKKVSRENLKLKQTLKEIKEIAGEMLQTKIPFCAIHEKIIEKINEVIDE